MIALSIRQPWAWLIFNAGKDIENRTWQTKFRGRVLVHAAKGMTKAEFKNARDFAYWDCDILELALTECEPEFLDRGGIVGSVEIVDCVSSSASPWFCGNYGFVLKNPQILPFVPFKGSLGFFDVPSAALVTLPANV